MNDILKIGKYELNSRLIVGSGKYKDFQTTKEATLASGSELILQIQMKKIYSIILKIQM